MNQVRSAIAVNVLEQSLFVADGRNGQVLLPVAGFTLWINVQITYAVAGVPSHLQDVRPAVTREVIGNVYHRRNRPIGGRIKRYRRIDLLADCEVRSQIIER